MNDLPESMSKLLNFIFNEPDYLVLMKFTDRRYYQMVRRANRSTGIK